MTDLLGYANVRTLATGAASGMGSAVANLRGTLGAEVVALDRKQGDLDSGVTFHRVDLRDRHEIDAALAVIGSVQQLFNCAGVQLTPNPLDTMLVSFVGLRHLTESDMATMDSGGAVGTITSIVAIDYREDLGRLTEVVTTPDFDSAIDWCRSDPGAMTKPYVVSKQAVAFYTIRRAWEVAPRGIRMNTTAPGPTQTPCSTRPSSSQARPSSPRFQSVSVGPQRPRIRHGRSFWSTAHSVPR